MVLGQQIYKKVRVKGRRRKPSANQAGHIGQLRPNQYGYPTRPRPNQIGFSAPLSSNRYNKEGTSFICFLFYSTLQTNFDLRIPKKDLAKPQFPISTKYMKT